MDEDSWIFIVFTCDRCHAKEKFKKVSELMDAMEEGWGHRMDGNVSPKAILLCSVCNRSVRIEQGEA